MNLLDKLRAIDHKTESAAKAPEKTFHDCYIRQEIRPPEEFPDQDMIRPELLRLLQSQDMPGTDPPSILYLDTETTGLGGGTGTVAFEIGCGHMEPQGFVLKQYVMRDYPEEIYVLQELEKELDQSDIICTFNGKSFDVPLLRSRFLMNRMNPSCLDLPHLDLLHLSRRIWKLRLQSCTLSRLEEEILGTPRLDDLPGSEAPQRYFTYLKTGDFSLLDKVLEHNAQDVASMCVLLGLLCARYDRPMDVEHAEDLYSMGIALDREQHADRARSVYSMVPDGKLHPGAQNRLALSYRRYGNMDEAIRIWQSMIRNREGGVEPYIHLAKYYEHRAGDPDKALEYTRQAMSLLAEPSLPSDKSVQEIRNALQYRYDRLKRKLILKGS